MTDTIVHLGDRALIDSLERHFPGIVAAIREARRRGLSKREIFDRCDAAGARELLLAACAAVIDEDHLDNLIP